MKNRDGAILSFGSGQIGEGALCFKGVACASCGSAAALFPGGG
jgi:hypothetical protein